MRGLRFACPIVWFRPECFRSGKIRIMDSNGTVARIIPFDETERKL